MKPLNKKEEESPLVTIKKIVEEGMCIGCGACAFASPDSYEMVINSDGFYSANVKIKSETQSGEIEKICPMSGLGMNEDEIAESLWPNSNHHSQVGRHLKTFSCHVSNDLDRLRSGSGGLVTWLCLELLERGAVDGVVQLKPINRNNSDVKSDDACANQLFEYTISRTSNDIRSSAKSRYYPMTLVDVLNELSLESGNYALVAVPCFIKSVRQLVYEGYLERSKITYFIGLVCGHLKTRYFADYLAWQNGIHPDEIASVDFRVKMPGRKSSDYGFTCTSEDKVRTSPMHDLQSRNWGEGQFKVPACEYCDDVLAECADISIGDAWLPEYLEDYKGENIVVNRSEKLGSIIDDGIESCKLNVNYVSVNKVVQSQQSGLRHRREGLSHRLARRLSKGLWVPRKRVDPVLAKTKRRRDIYDAREAIAKKSNLIFREALLSNDISVYNKKMERDLLALNKLTRKPLLNRLTSRFKRLVLSR